MTAAPAPIAPPAVEAPMHGRLAFALQDVLTVVVRLRSDRYPVTDATAFRAHVRSLLAKAEQQGVALGYPAENVRLGIFAAVAFLDESVLNSRQPALAEWGRRPLQEEMFGGHMAGEWFFQYLDQLQARPDDPWLADVLDVFHQVLLLGFRGRFGSDAAGLQAVAQRTGERVARLRGAPGDLAPRWRPPADALVRRDPWVRRLFIALAASVVLVALLWTTAGVTLSGAARDVRAMTPTTGVR